MCVPPSRSLHLPPAGFAGFPLMPASPGRYQPSRDQGVRQTVVEGPSDCLSRKGMERSFQPFCAFTLNT